MNNTILNVRNMMKAKKPDFERQDANKYNQFSGKWRRPRGIHNKMRRGFKGHKAMPSIGYSSPKVVKGLTGSGLNPVLIHNLDDLGKIKNNCIAVISRRIGLKKKLEILKTAKEKSVNVLGIKDIDGFINNAKEKLSKRKKVSEIKKVEHKKRDEKSVDGVKKKDESQK